MLRKSLLFLLMLFASYSDIFLFRIGIVPVSPSKFLIPLFLVLFFLQNPITKFLDLFKSHTFGFLLVILVLKIFYSIPSKADDSIILELVVLQILTILLYIAAVHTFRTAEKKDLILFFLLSIVVLGGSVWYDFFIGLPKYKVSLEESLRKGGFAENPNQSASAMKFLFLGFLYLINRNILFRNLLIFFVVASVFLTFSRSGIVSIIVILFLGTLNNWENIIKLNPIKQSKNIVKIFFLFISLYGVLVIFADVIRTEVPAFNRGAAGERLDLLLGKSDNVVVQSGEDNELSRIGLFKKYLNDFFDNPWGYGTGYSADKAFNRLKTHNYYLYFAVNLGIVALMVYLFYLFRNISIGLRKKQAFYLIFGLVLVLEGLFSHSIFFERAILIAIAFFDSTIYALKINESSDQKDQ